MVNKFADLIHGLTAPNIFGVIARAGIVTAFTLASIGGAWLLMTPTDYLPRGNQNLVFGFLLTPPGYNIEHFEDIGRRVESTLRPYWEAEEYADLKDVKPPMNPMTHQPLKHVPPLENYFFVAYQGNAFNGATSKDPQNVGAVAQLLTSATSQIPGTIGFAQQAPLFGRGLSGSRSVSVEVLGLNMDSVRDSASALRGRLAQAYGPFAIRPTPSQFDKPAP